jgi:hypothetical protein
MGVAAELGLVTTHAVVVRVLTREQGRARRRALRKRGVRVLEARPFAISWR